MGKAAAAAPAPQTGLSQEQMQYQLLLNQMDKQSADADRALESLKAQSQAFTQSKQIEANKAVSFESISATKEVGLANIEVNKRQLEVQAERDKMDFQIRNKLADNDKLYKESYGKWLTESIDLEKQKVKNQKEIADRTRDQAEGNTEKVAWNPGGTTGTLFKKTPEGERIRYDVTKQSDGTYKMARHKSEEDGTPSNSTGNTAATTGASTSTSSAATTTTDSATTGGGATGSDSAPLLKSKL